MCILEGKSLSSEFSALLSNAFTGSGIEQLFSLAFVFTVETGFIPTSLAEYFDSTNSNNEVAKMINNLPLNTFWHHNNNIYNAQLIMSDQLCCLTGVPNYDSLIITLSYLNKSKCIIFPSILEKREVSSLAKKYKNMVSVPIKCDVLSTTTGQYPSLCGIPEELTLYIMSKLNSPDLYALMRSCKHIHNLAMTNQILWKKLTIHDFPNEVNRDQDLIKFITDWRKYYFGLKKAKKLKIRGKRFRYMVLTFQPPPF